MKNNSVRWLLACLALLALPLWLWQAPLLAQWDKTWAQARAKLPATPGATGGAGGAASQTAPRKCEQADGSLLYTTEACPAGSRERGLQGGTVTVMSAPAVATPASAASATPLLRRLAGPQDSEALREKMMERAGAQ